MSLLLEYWNCTEDPEHEVYNYSNAPSSMRTLVVSSSTLIFRHRISYMLQEEGKIDAEERKQYEPFLQVKKSEHTFQVKNAHNLKGFDSFEQMLCLVSTSEVEGQKQLDLMEKTIIKLGMVTLVVEKVKAPKWSRRGESKTFYEEENFSKIEQIRRVGVDFYDDVSCASTLEDAPTCRYCFSKSLTPNNEFLSICKCEGSSKFVHVSCLSMWVMQRCGYMEVSKGIFAARRKGMICEICKELFPLEEVLPCFQDEGLNEYAIISASAGKEQTVYIIQLGESRQISVGRKSECDITLQDPSISRVHCFLRWDAGTNTLRVDDHSSKFGTLVKKSSLEVRESALMQRGRTKLRITPKSRRFAVGRAVKELFSFSKYKGV